MENYYKSPTLNIITDEIHFLLNLLGMVITYKKILLYIYGYRWTLELTLQDSKLNFALIELILAWGGCSIRALVSNTNT
jgi:hypothetical protein